jgi:glycogen debranching enzyme
MPAVLNGPENLVVRVALRDTRTNVYQTEFRWPSLDRLGPNDYAGVYANVTLTFGEVKWSFEMARAEDGRVILLVRPLDPATAEGIQVRLETFYQTADGGEVVTREEDVIARRHGHAWRVHSPSPTSHRDGTTITGPLSRPFFAIVERADEEGRSLEARTVEERVPAGAESPLTEGERKLASLVSAARSSYLGRFKGVPDEFWWAYAGVVYGVGWNMIWAADLGQPVSVCSRDWCVHGNYGAWVLFNWDQWMVAAAAADWDVELAHQILRPQFEQQTEDGLIPGVASPLGISADRGMPPMATYGVLKCFLRSGDRRFLTDYYDRLCRYHAWWKRNRDGNGDGLFEWGSNPTEPAHPQWQTHTHWAARYETGMDNNPMWDGVPFNEDTNTLEQSDIGLNALLALDALCLARMADLLGRAEDADRYRAGAEAHGQLLERKLWNDETGLWLSRNWDGSWNTTANPCCFYPFFLPTAEKEHVRRAVEEHLQNPNRFGGEYVMPVTPRDHPAYPDQYYVRGRIWPEQTLLVHSGLREAGEEEAAAELARGALRTMKAEWLEKGHLHENYHADTADGDDTPESDPLYSFGVMMPLIGWFHLSDVNIDGAAVQGELADLDGFLDTTGAWRKRVDPVDQLPALE